MMASLPSDRWSTCYEGLSATRNSVRLYSALGDRTEFQEANDAAADASGRLLLVASAIQEPIFDRVRHESDLDQDGGHIRPVETSDVGAFL